MSCAAIRASAPPRLCPVMVTWTFLAGEVPRVGHLVADASDEVAVVVAGAHVERRGEERFNAMAKISDVRSL
ncbi:hypothetical protein [Oryza sativa Japonica Group]|jgi:hypothetical protein|uniref:Uncharacterized protein n=2 Tax=Oryza sativa subsp. japonica TaxID=39947 RepID=A0A979HKE5_ORYSJ|nr:hypothetical protein [Oryza sativa Japonica Group]BAS74676.1 Os01g0784425 [Oryza sativa Japonica Group]